MTNLDSTFKSRDITLPTKVRLVKAMVFPVVVYGCESWTVKKAEHWRIDAFELWCWRGLLRVPWAARRSNQSILKEISPGCSLEGVMLELKLQYFGHLMRRADSLEKTLMLGKIEGSSWRGWQWMRWLDGIIDSMDMGLGRLRQLGIDREGWRAAFHGVAKSQTRLSDWTKSFDKFSPHLWPHLLALLPSWLYIKASQPYKNLKGLSFICNLVLLHLSHKSPIEDYHKTLLSLLYYLLLIWALLEKKNLQTCMHFMQLHLWSQFSITPLPSLLSFPFLLLPLA